MTYDLSVAGVPAEWVDLVSQLTVPAGGTVDLPLKLTSDPFAELADYGFVVNATVAGIGSSIEGTLTLAGDPILPEAQPIARGVVAQLQPSQSTAGQPSTAGQGTAAHYTVRVFNTGSRSDDFVLFVSGLPAGFRTSFGAGIFDVPPGSSNFRDVLLTIVPPAGTTADDYAFNVTAASTTDVSITGISDASLTVRAIGVAVDVSPDSVHPNSTFQMVVTNTGLVTDTFDLSLAAPAALVATLGTIEVTLDPGQSQSISIDVGEVDFAVPGSLQLVSTAISRTDTAIMDADTVEVIIVERRGVALGAIQPTIRLPAPGDTSTRLIVDNLGNLEDEFTAMILGTSGPVTASLVGVNGEPAQTIPLFILPGLTSGRIPLDAKLTDFGQGLVTVEVRSLLDDSIVATYTVTISTEAGLDHGDSPDGMEVGGVLRQYGTLNSNNGAHHKLGSGLTLGVGVDAEGDGQATELADGDGSDEDGVVPIASLVSTASEATLASFLVTASLPGKLDVWVDFDLNGQFDHPSEHLGAGTSFDVPAGDTIIPVPVPSGAASGVSFVRFRLSTAGGLAPDGEASDGEVEDYVAPILNGIVGADASVNLIAGDVAVVAENFDVVVRHDTIELFRAPGGSLASTAFIGNGDDNLVSLGNLASALPAPLGLIFHGGDGVDTLKLSGSNQMLDVSDTMLTELRDVEIVDVVGASPNTLVLDRAGVVAATDANHTLVVIHDEDDTVDYAGDDWVVQAPIFVDGGHRHLLTNGEATVQTINTRPWTNPLEATDVDFSGQTTALDALQVINFLGRSQSLSVELPKPTSASGLPERYYDVNGSLTATALDALTVINFLALQRLTGQGESFADSRIEAVSPAPLLPYQAKRTTEGQDARSISQLDIAIDELIRRRASQVSVSNAPWIESAEVPLELDCLDHTRSQNPPLSDLDSIDQSLQELFL